MKKALLLAWTLVSLPVFALAADPAGQGLRTSRSGPDFAEFARMRGVPATATVRPPAPRQFKAVAAGMSLDQAFATLNGHETDVMARVRFVPANDDALYARWKIVEDAKETIDCTYYIIDKDIFGQAFMGLLARKARQGVKVRLMIDGRIYRSGYMKGMPDVFQELARDPNVQIRVYNSVGKSLLLAFSDFKGLFASNHDKILIGDGRVSIIGGRNIGSDYFVGKGEYSCVYRDTDIVMEGGNVAARLKKAFDDEWASLRNGVVNPELLNLRSQKARLELADRVMSHYLLGRGVIDPATTGLPPAAQKIMAELNAEIIQFKNISNYGNYRLFGGEPERPVKIIDKSSSFGNLNDITSCLISFIDAAKDEIVIQNPYVVITSEAYAALRRASSRGVKIVFHTNSGASTDSLFPQAFLMNDWVTMLADMPTCRLFVAPGVNERLHSKTFVFDSSVTVIGSYNMDPLSQNSNSEVVAAIHDARFAQQAREQIRKDMAKVIEYRIAVGPDGRAVSAFGPQDHLSPKILKKMNFFRRLGWIRPVI